MESSRGDHDRNEFYQRMGRKICNSNTQIGNFIMIFTEIKLKGAYIIELEKLEDERGFFARSWDKNEFKERRLNQNLLDIHKKASEHNDAQLTDFLESNYLYEQVKDQKKLSDYIRNIERCEKDELGIFLFDKNFITVFEDPLNISKKILGILSGLFLTTF